MAMDQTQGSTISSPSHLIKNHCSMGNQNVLPPKYQLNDELVSLYLKVLDVLTWGLKYSSTQ